MNGLSPADLTLLGAVAFATAVMTAMVGLGGGIILLSVMAIYLEPVIAIPVHGAVQLASNASRTWIQRRHVRWPILGRFAVLLVPGSILGLLVARTLPAEAVRTGIGVFVLLAIWAPKWLFLGIDPEHTHPTRRFLWLGGAIGFLNTAVGAVGPLLGPFLRGIGLTRHGIVGSFAAVQSLGHAVKIVVFTVAGFAFAAWLGPIALLAGCVVAGTWVGSRLLDRVPERVFQLLYKASLTALALRLLVAPFL